MAVFAALTFTQEPSNLSAFSRYLQQLQFPHRVSEENQQLVLWVYDEAHIAWVQQQYTLFSQQALQLPINEKNTLKLPWHQLLQVPVTAVLALGCILGFVVVFSNLITVVELLSFQGFQLNYQQQQLQMNSTQAWLHLLAQGEIWRLFTPIFLHFNWLHISFNVVLFVYFAAQVERMKGALFLISMVALMAAMSNYAQFLTSNQLFGGMSGVDYGLLSFCAMINFRAKTTIFQCPAGLFWFSIIMILLGFTPFYALFGMSMANGAHIAGFVVGIMLALLTHIPKERLV